MNTDLRVAYSMIGYKMTTQFWVLYLSPDLSHLPPPHFPPPPSFSSKRELVFWSHSGTIQVNKGSQSLQKLNKLTYLASTQFTVEFQSTFLMKQYTSSLCHTECFTLHVSFHTVLKSSWCDCLIFSRFSQLIISFLPQNCNQFLANLYKWLSPNS